MFDWIGDALEWVGDKFSDVGTAISEAVWDVMLEWLFNTIYGAVAEFFGMINGMGVDIFSQSWVSAFLQLFSLFGWTLFAAGLVVAVFDMAIEYQTGRSNIQSTCLNVLKGFMAVSLFTKVPVELYKFCITLQTTFSGDLIGAFVGANRSDLGATAEVVLKNMGGYSGLLGLLTLIALVYCVVKLFFANIKRGGILLCQIAVGSLYMFSIPRGFSDGFNGWCKQIFALCLTAFLQTDVFRITDVADQYAAGTWYYVSGERSAENCAAVRIGYFCESKHDERNSYSEFCDSCRKICGVEAGVKEAKN